MTPSIRTYLLINLLLSVLLITSFAVIGNLYLEHKHIRYQLDTQLIKSILQIEALIDNGKDNINTQSTQQDLNKILNPTITQDDLYSENKILKLAPQIIYQVWNLKNKKLLLHSPDTQATTLSNKTPGWSNIEYNKDNWRVLTSRDTEKNVAIIVAQRNSSRNALETLLTRDSILIILITAPFFALLIWIIVGRALNTLIKVTEEVKMRSPGNLHPVDIDSAPTEIAPLLKELNNLFVCLKDALEREKRFAADAAHELKTPLAALKTQTQAALKADNSKELKQALKKIITGVERSSHVINQLLILSRMVPQSHTISMEHVDLNQLVTTICALLAPDAINKNIDFSLDCQIKPAMINASKTSIDILLRNLIDNSIRYTPEHGKIVVTTAKHEHSIILSVCDNGPGIPYELHNRVFERFYRIVGNNATGSGLGLGIVKQIATIHDAQIQLAEGIEGKGLGIYIRFPMNDE